jgi:plasmid stabilization system protein ParE
MYAIHTFIEEKNVSASYEIVNRISDAVRTLEDFPEIGRRGKVAGTRELVVSGTPYIVAYLIRPSSLWILAVLHSAQRWPKSFDVPVE